MLNADTPYYVVWRDTIGRREGIDLIRIPNSRGKRNGTGNGKRVAIPGAESGSPGAGRIPREGAIQQVAVVDCHLVGAVLVRAAIEIIPGEPALKNGLVGQGVREAGPGTQVIPADVGAVVAGAARAIAEFAGRPRQTSRPGIGNRRIEEYDQVVHLCEWHHDVPSQADVDGEVWLYLDVFLNVRCEAAIKRSKVVVVE